MQATHIQRHSLYTLRSKEEEAAAAMASSLQSRLQKGLRCARSFLLVGLILQPFLHSLSQPIPPPDLATCHLPFNLPAAEPPFNCCAPQSNQSAIEFHLNQSAPAQPLRVRRSAHSLGEDYAQKLIRGYDLMRALPDDDPRSFRQQANIHCAYCNMVYLQPNTSVYYQVHASWLFFSFHRWYLYFHERILASLLNDDTFALPFWHYDSPSASTMPSMYADHPELFDIIREPAHEPPAVVDLDFYNQTDRPAAEQLTMNAHFMYFIMITGGSTQHGFFGQPLHLGEQYTGHGTVEFSPHNTVHSWVGNRRAVGWRDMGSLYAAARDPVFYAHHANLDRLWDVWKTINPNNTDIDDPDYLDSGFSFYNEDARLVHVRVRDSLDSARLGYAYEEVENPWITAQPAPLSHGPAVLPEGASLCRQGGTVSQPCSFVVIRPLQAKSSFLSEADSHESLVFEGIHVESWDMEARFDVFVNLPTADELTTLACAEYAGSFSMLPQFVSNSTIANQIHMSLSLASLDPILGRLNLRNEESLIVTIVPRSVSLCSISSVRVSLEQPQPYYS